MEPNYTNLACLEFINRLNIILSSCNFILQRFFIHTKAVRMFSLNTFLNSLGLIITSDPILQTCTFKLASQFLPSFKLFLDSLPERKESTDGKIMMVCARPNSFNVIKISYISCWRHIENREIDKSTIILPSPVVRQWSANLYCYLFKAVTAGMRHDYLGVVRMNYDTPWHHVVL